MEMRNDAYRTVARESECRLKFRRSLFVARVRETGPEDSARRFLQEVQAQHRQATHHCWARRLGYHPPHEDAWSDDNEPPGTAGRPLHGAITRLGLCNVTLVVARYFGGQKLGVRGLIEAYGEAAREALDQAGVVTRRPGCLLSVVCPYPRLGQLQSLLDEAGGHIHGADYREHAALQLLVPRSQAPAFIRQLEELGQAVSRACDQ